MTILPSMRIAMVDPSLFTLPYDRALAMGLAELGHSVTLHARSPGIGDGEAGGITIANDFYRVADMPAVRRSPPPLRLALKGVDHVVSMRRLLQRLRQERPEAIHFQWLPLPLLDRAFLAAFSAVAPLILTVHDTDPFNGNPASRLQRMGFFDALRRFGAVIVHTEQGRKRLLAQGVEADRVSVLPHGLIGTCATASTLGPSGGDEETTFLMFGKIKPYKGVDLLIEAFAKMPPELQARSRMRVVGKPYMDLAPLHALAERLGVAKRLSLEPVFVPDADIPALFGRDTVAVFPYREIEASGVLSVAFAQGRPVIAAALGSFAETVVDGVHGHLVAPENVNALAGALSHLAADHGFRMNCAMAVGRSADAIPRWRDIALMTTTIYRQARLRRTLIAA